MLRIRWLGRVPYGEALTLQQTLHDNSPDDYVLLLEHPHVFTLGVRADLSHVLVDPPAVGAELVRANRGGDVTYHGPGQLVAYPIVGVPMATASIPAHVGAVEQLAMETLRELGLESGTLDGFPGVWVDPESANPRKICAVGVRVSRGRSMHGLALNINPDLDWFDRIVPCGIEDKAVTSLANEGIDVPFSAAVESMARAATRIWGGGTGAGRADHEYQGLPHRARSVRSAAGRSAAVRVEGEAVKLRLRQAGVEVQGAVPIRSPKPAWLRARAHMGREFLDLKRTMRGLGLVTVCEEAGCPNIFECWADGTATFMINGERCTRACGFCLVDTRHPVAIDELEPERVAEAVQRMQLGHAVVTAVARDDLADGGANAFAATIEAIRRRCPHTTIEVLIPDLKGDDTSLGRVFDARPEVLNHNLETVLRLQRAVRPSAAYTRSLFVLAKAKEAGLVTKSGLILGMGETEKEVLGALADLRSAGVDIVTMGQYLRPSAAHAPVARWWRPEEFERLEDAALDMGFSHVQSSPLTRSSYHARDAARAAASAGEARVTGTGVK